MKRIASFAIALCVIDAAASEGPCGLTPVLSAEQDGKRFQLVVDSAHVQKTPAWNPSKGDPPLSFAELVTAAMAWAKERYKRYDSVTIREITLVEYGCSRMQDRWYYRVDFSPVMDGKRLWGSGYFAAVLMDGTVVGPTESQVSPNPSLERP